MPEQRNPYHGTPPRAPFRLRLVGADGSSTEKELLADTGNPYALIINSREMQRLRLLKGADVNTNFGLLEGGWLRVVIPEISFDRQVFGYGSDEVVAAAQSSSPGFQGLAGLPLLRMMEYGGDGASFWLRTYGVLGTT